MTAIREKLEQLKFAGQVGDDSQGDYREAMNTATRDQVKELVELVEMLIDRLDNQCT
jgi:hypothetical protein